MMSEHDERGEAVPGKRQPGAAAGGRDVRRRAEPEEPVAAGGRGLHDATAGLMEEAALGLLRHPDLASDEIERLCGNSALMKSRKVQLALLEHPHTPRHVSLPLVRHLFTFDLMQVALAPVAPADVKMAAEDALIRRLESVSLGEKIALARRASGRVAAELLVDPELRVVNAAFENSRLTEAQVVRALTREDVPAAFVERLCKHPEWSCRREVRVAALRSPHTPMASALEFARSLPATLVHEILPASELPSRIKDYLERELRGDSERG